MNKFIRTTFFVSALAPAILVSALVKIQQIKPTTELICWLAASLIASVLPFLIINAASKLTESIPFKAKKIESQDWLLITFFATYFIPIILKPGDFDFYIKIIIIASILLTTIEALPCHPLLHFFKYRFYKVEGENGIVYTLISKGKIYKASDLKNVQQLSTQLLLRNNV